MPRARVWSAAAACVAACCLTAGVSAQDPVNAPPRGAQDTAPARITPGAVVLLVNSQGPAATGMLRRALVDPDRDVRRAAARVAAAAHREVYAGLMEALKTERDEAVSVELAKAAMILAGSNGVSIVEPFAQRAGASAHLQVIEWVARMEPDRFAARLPDWMALGEPVAADMPELVGLAALRHPASRDAVLRAWMAVAPEHGWGHVLRRVYKATDASASRDAILAEALASDRPAVRSETLWFVLKILSLRGPIQPSLVEAASRPSQDGDEWAAFGRELIARLASNKGAVAQDDLVRRVGGRHRADLFVAWTSGRLTSAEKSVIKDMHANVTISPLDDHESTMVTPDPVAARLLESTEAAADCHAEDTIGLADVTFGPDGKAASILLKQPPVPPKCQPVLTAIARFSAAARQDVGFEPQLLVVPLSSAFASCAAGLEPHTPLARADTRQAGLELPRLAQEVKPSYTRSAKDRRVEGVVELEARLTATGCVASLRVTQSLDAELDIQAIKAALVWRFAPARLNGAPIPMVVSIQITFRL